MLELRLGHQRGNEKRKRRGLWTDAHMTISKSPSPSVRQQMSDKQLPALDLGKSLFLNRGFSPVFWLFSFLSSSSRSWWKKRDAAQYRCHQGKGKNLVSTLQCHPQHNGQNTTKKSIQQKIKLQCILFGMGINTSVSNRLRFFNKSIRVLNCVTCLSPLPNSPSS